MGFPGCNQAVSIPGMTCWWFFNKHADYNVLKSLTKLYLFGFCKVSRR